MDTKRTFPFCPPQAWALFFCVLLGLGDTAGWADTVPEYYDRITLIRGQSRAREADLTRILDNPASTPAQREQAQRDLDALWDGEFRAQILAGERYRFQQSLPGRIGQTQIAGFSPIARLHEGETTSLTFQFIDPITLLPNPGPIIGSVLYEVNLDPDFPDAFLAIGRSVDATSSFSFPFTVQGYEPIIRAIPSDTSGIPIFIDGAGGFNVAIGFAGTIPPSVIPEPSTFILFSFGTLNLIVYYWRRRSRTGAG